MKFENLLPGIRKETFHIPKEMIITGSFKADTAGQVAGIVNGYIQVNGKLIITKDAIINGNILATDIMVYGKITGDVKCFSKMFVQTGARIRGNIHTAEIHLEKGSLVDGVITKLSSSYPEFGDEKVIEKRKPANPIPEVKNEVKDTGQEWWF